LETMCVEKGRWQKHRIDTGINITISIMAYWGEFSEEIIPAKQPANVVLWHLMFISS
jgi:hypothetical protein